MSPSRGLGEFLRTCRQGHAHLSQTEVAAQIGVERTIYARLESGAIVCDLVRLDKVLTVLVGGAEVLLSAEGAREALLNAMRYSGCPACRVTAGMILSAPVGLEQHLWRTAVHCSVEPV